MASKIIVAGDVDGQFLPFFTRINKLHAGKHFSFVLVSGNLFSESGDEVDGLLEGKVVVPLPTYFTAGTTPLPQKVIDRIENDEEIAENLHFLGKRSTTKTTEGVKIVALGGNLDEAIVGLSKEQVLPYHTIEDAKALKGAHGCDILLTTCWPASVRNGSKILIPDGKSTPTGHQNISDLCSHLRPRYCFSRNPEFFFEREPFFNDPTPDDQSKPLTRFLSLPTYLTTKKLYAFTLQPSVDSTAMLPLNTTASPFQDKVVNGRKRSALEPDPYSRHGNHDVNGYSKHGRGRKRAREKQPPPGPEQCYFCLMNPNLPMHLICCIGTEAYLTLSKGPLLKPETNTQFGIDFPAHVLIIPLAHSATLALVTDASDPDSREKTFAEMTKFKETLQTMIAEKSGNKLGAVIYEISKGNGVHTHWQFVPMPEELISKGLVEAGFRVEAENLRYPNFETRDPGLGKEDGDFFRVWIWTPPTALKPEGTTKCLTMSFDYRLRFDLQFGRRVLAKLLGLENRTHWKDCPQTEDEEKRDAAAFKEAYKIYDFTD